VQFEVGKYMKKTFSCANFISKKADRLKTLIFSSAHRFNSNKKLFHKSMFARPESIFFAQKNDAIRGMICLKKLKKLRGM
jgi:hypothetical protein